MAKRSTRKEDAAGEADEQEAEATFVRKALTALEQRVAALEARAAAADEIDRKLGKKP